MPRSNPPRIPPDTSRDVWERQMEAIAARTEAERLAEWQQFNAEMSRLEAEAVHRRHPDYSDDEVLRALVRHRYGDDLTSKVWPHLVLVDL